MATVKRTIINNNPQDGEIYRQGPESPSFYSMGLLEPARKGKGGR